MWKFLIKQRKIFIDPILMLYGKLKEKLFLKVAKLLGMVNID